MAFYKLLLGDVKFMILLNFMLVFGDFLDVLPTHPFIYTLIFW